MRPFEEVVAEHGDVVFRVCRALLGPDDAHDAWSETFLAALRAYPDLAPGSNVRGWLVTIAHRKGIDRIRSNARTPRPTGELPDPGVWDAPAEPDPDLGAAVQALPPKQRAAVVYRYLADLSYAEIGDLLDSNEAAARRSAADGIATLRKRYAKGTQR